MKKNRDKAGGIPAPEIRGLLLLLPVAAVAAIVLIHARRPARREVVEPVAFRTATKAIKNVPAEGDTVRMFRFDPNTADLRTLLDLGLETRTAVSIIKYRESGKVFAIKEDLASTYGLEIDEYFRLEPYIDIGERFRPQPRSANRDHDGHRPTPQTAGSRLYGEHAAAAPAPVLVELNTADTALLRTVRGIGAYTAAAIADYRERLGGFANEDQLREVRGMREENFETIRTQIFVDSCIIQKIDINFAVPKQLNATLSAHPYAGALVVRKLLKTRQLKGGWRNIQEMVQDDILSEEQAAKLAPYLIFTDWSTDF